MAWGIAARVEKLRVALGWKGNEAAFLEFVHKTIKCMPELLQDAMLRYYVLGETQLRSEETGEIPAEDSRFYQFTSSGREVLSTILELTHNYPEVISLLAEESKQHETY